MYENETYDVILQRMLDRVSDKLDKRESSLIWDTHSSTAIELQIIPSLGFLTPLAPILKTVLSEIIGYEKDIILFNSYNLYVYRDYKCIC